MVGVGLYYLPTMCIHVTIQLKGSVDRLHPEDCPAMELYLINLARKDAGSNTCVSNTRDGVSMGYPTTKNRVENNMRSGVFLMKFKVFR